MAGWSIFTDGCALEYLDILKNLQSNGFCLDLDSASMKAGAGNDDGRNDNKLRCLFDQILFVFLKGTLRGGEIRTLPAMLGDGRSVDLFTLFSIVRQKGGYDLVSSNGLWASVAEESGLGSEVAAAVKLLYIKYLDTLDRCLRIIFSDNGIDGGLRLDNCSRNLGLLPMGLATEFNSMLPAVREEKAKVDEDTQESKLEEKDPQVQMLGNTDEVESAMEMYHSKKCIDDDNKCTILEKCADEEELHSGKRKRESLMGMLKWVIDIAKRPSHLGIGKSMDEQEFKVLALLARNALSRGRHIHLSAENSLLQKKQKTHPSMYEDQIGIERLRCSERLVSQRNSCLLSCSESNDLDTSITTSIVGKEIHKPNVVSESQTANMVVDKFDDPFRKRVPIGSLFQAQVPEWTGVALDTDTKWYGTQHWPLAMSENSSVLESDSIGKGRQPLFGMGRQHLCGCRYPGSVECVRFHIAERKMALKLELGVTFYRWGFNHMGEEVSLSWAEDEEKKFKDIVRQNPPSLDKCFWDQARRCFPSRRWRSLVSYYFNVFVLRRRSYQNRVSPANVDSDDDESEFGSVSNGFGNEAVKVPDSTSIFCAQNNQCIDLD